MMAGYMDDSTYGNMMNQGGVQGFAGIAGAIPGVNIFSPGITAMLAGQGEASTRDAMLHNAEDLNLPEFMTNYQNEAYAGDLAPEMYGSPEAAQAVLAKMDPETLAARRKAIDMLLSQGNGAAAAQEDAQRRTALFDAAQQAGAQSAGLREEMAARGKGGAGAEWAMRQRAGQAGANQAMLGGLQADAQGQAARLAALNAYERSLSGLGEDQQALDTHNADIASQFNMANTQLRNQVNMANTGMRNAAQQRNLDARQRNIGTNVGIHNQSVDSGNQLKQLAFENARSKLAGVQGVLSGQADAWKNAYKTGTDAGKLGYSNLQSLAGGMAGGMGGGAGGGGAGGVDFSKYMSMFGGG